MRRAHAGVVLLAVQLLLVLSVAGKYVYERRTCPRVWSRATQVDPNAPLRGRYLAMSLLVDACGLPRDEAYHTNEYGYGTPVPNRPDAWAWDVSLEPKDGHLQPRLDDRSRDPAGMDHLVLGPSDRCERLALRPGVQFFVPDRAQVPFPLKKSEELWVEVTLPPSGPPRPIQLALSTDGVFRLLHLD